MKIYFVLFSALFVSAITPAKPKRVIFFGDSITQMGVNQGGYIDQMQKKMQASGSANQYELIGAGIGGNKIYDLYLRHEEDVLAKKPDAVVIYVGINDVWHKTSGIGTDIAKYEQFYIALIKKFQAQGIKVYMATPSVIGEKKDGSNPQDSDLDAYSAVIRLLAGKYGCTLIDLRAAFASYEKMNNPENKESGILTTDRVHLNEKGNELVANEMMKALSIQ